MTIDEQRFFDLVTKLEGLTAEIKTQNELTGRFMAENEKEHKRFDNEFASVSKTLQHDRESYNAKIDKIINSFGEIAVLNSQVKGVTKTLEDRRMDTRELFESQSTMSQDLNKGLATIREALNESSVRLHAETDTKLRTLEKDITQSMAELEARLDTVEQKIQQSAGWGQALNWILTAGLAAAFIVYEIITG